MRLRAMSAMSQRCLAAPAQHDPAKMTAGDQGSILKEVGDSGARPLHVAANFLNDTVAQQDFHLHLADHVVSHSHLKEALNLALADFLVQF